jgi:hypothetical protein
MKKLAILLVPFFASGIILSSLACGSGDKGTTLSHLAQPPSTITSEHHVTLDPVEITIGNLTDITGQGWSQLFILAIANLSLSFVYEI